MTLNERRRRGQEIVKKYRSCSGTDPYACASDAIADILLYVSQSEDESTKIVLSAEMDFRNSLESESFAAEG
jgi:hypothetical protein